MSQVCKGLALEFGIEACLVIKAHANLHMSLVHPICLAPTFDRLSFTALATMADYYLSPAKVERPSFPRTRTGQAVMQLMPTAISDGT